MIPEDQPIGLIHAYRCCTCNGTGIDADNARCRDCDGTGIDNHD